VYYNLGQSAGKVAAIGLELTFSGGQWGGGRGRGNRVTEVIEEVLNSEGLLGIKAREEGVKGAHER
ncbi:hypothetical protein EC968_000763, partial [Mortierella alpina]